MKNIFFLALAYVSLTTINSSCNTIAEDSSDSVYMDYDHEVVPYRFYKPEDIFLLDNDLEEISGMSMIDGNLAVVEDERGILYLLNSADGQVIRKIRFAGEGDYEGVEVIDGTAYVIKSDGEILSFQLSEQEAVDGMVTATPFSSDNNVEGLGYNEGHLLIACKEEGALNGKKIEGKGIYVYSLANKKLVMKPAITLHQRDLEEQIENNNHFKKVKRFNPSAIAVNPQSGHFYVLSANGTLVVLSERYQLLEVVPLDKDLYPQAEGICFAPDGTMFISSEGDGGKGKLFKLSPIA